MADFATYPLVPERWDDLVTVFGGGDGKGDCGRCWCMWWRLPRPSVVAGLGKQNKALFKERVDAGPAPGLIGYDDTRRLGPGRVTDGCPQLEHPSAPQRAPRPKGR